MCTGLEIAALAATVGGTALQMRSQQQAREKTQSAMRSNNQKNAQLEQLNAAEAARARQGFQRGTFDQNLDQNVGDLIQKYQGAQSDGSIPGEFAYRTDSSAPEIVKNFETKKRGEAKAFSNDYARHLAEMSGFGNVMFNRGVDALRSSEVEKMNNSFAAGNNNVLQARLAAIQANSGSPLGDALATVGQIGMTAGARAPAAAAKPPTALAPSALRTPTAWNQTMMPTARPMQIPGMPSFGGLY